jgi:hypothetical protein
VFVESWFRVLVLVVAGAGGQVFIWGVDRPFLLLVVLPLFVAARTFIFYCSSFFFNYILFCTTVQLTYYTPGTAEADDWFDGRGGKKTIIMAKLNMAEVWADIKTYRRAYMLTAVASFGGMLFGWDTGLIGGTYPTHIHIHNMQRASEVFHVPCSCFFSERVFFCC